MASYVGIDLGTTESTVSVIEIDSRLDEPLEKLKTLSIYQYDSSHKFDRDNKGLQSSIYIDRDNKVIYTGEYAKALYSSGNKPLNTIRSIKTRIGGESMIDIPLGNNKKDLKAYDMTELSAVLLKSIKKSLDKQLNGNSIETTTITIPAGFNSDEREATLDAAKIAGFKDIQLLDEPTAVLLNILNLEEPLIEDEFLYEAKNILVYDLGGGTLDISIANVEEENGDYNVKILGRSQRMDFGGDDVDKYIAAYFLEEFEKINPSINERSIEEQAVIVSRIVSQAEKSKIAFDTKISKVLEHQRRRQKAKESVNFEIIDNLKVTDLILTDEILKKLLANIIDENGFLLMPLKKSLKGIGLKKEDIDLVILTGGSSKFYLVEETIQRFFNINNGLEETPIISFTSSNAVSRGAVIHSHNKNNEDLKKIELSDTLSDSIFIKVGNKFHELISQNLGSKNRGTYKYKFETPSKRLEVFLYSGISTEEKYKYKEITGVYRVLDRWHDKDEEIEIKWEFTSDKVVHLYFEEEELLNTKKDYDEVCSLINEFEINKI